MPLLSSVRGVGGEPSSKKRSRDLAVQVEDLRALLEDQSRTLMRAQEQAIHQAIQGLEERRGRVLERLTTQQEAQTASFQAVEARQGSTP